MAKVKFGIAVDEDLGASRSEIIEAILTAYVRSDSDHAEQARELIIRQRKGTL